MNDIINLKLVVWRQESSSREGRFVEYNLNDISTHMSFLEMFDVLNEQLIAENLESLCFLGSLESSPLSVTRHPGELSKS